MTVFLIILQYLVAAIVDLFDKFLISKRKVEPFAYTFFTLVFGLFYLVIWPWVYEPLSGGEIALNLLSGAVFAATLYVFFKALSQGEVSRVVPFVFGLVPVFDMLIVWATGRNALLLSELAALCLLVPGAFLISYRRQNFSLKHVGLKVFAAFLFSMDYALWQYGNTTGNMLNHLMWDRLASAGIVVALLAWPYFRRKAFKHAHVPNQRQTAWLFLAKQAIGGLNFLFFSWLLVVGKIPLVNGLQGFRYFFLLLASLALSRRHKHILDEPASRHELSLKLAALVLIFAGTSILFAF